MTATHQRRLSILDKYSRKQTNIVVNTEQAPLRICDALDGSCAFEES